MHFLSLRAFGFSLLALVVEVCRPETLLAKPRFSKGLSPKP